MRPVLTARGRAALAGGLAAIAYGRLFGTAELALVGGALVAAVGVARAWVGLAGGPHIAVRSLPPFARAGERIAVEVELRPLAGARPGRSAFREHGVEAACALRPVAAEGLRVLRGSYELGPLPRGVHELGTGELIREDPFGLARRVDATRGSAVLTVVALPLELPEVLPAGGGDAMLARQRLRGGGHELHGVREHQAGESLRGVHWPATAHQARLMVKELDDPGGDELAVVLDARSSADVGTPPDSSFELAVAAAAALVERAHADSQRVRLVIAGGQAEPASASERTAVRRLLARVRPGGERAPGELVTRLAAERIEVITSRPAAFVGVAPARRLGVTAIDPASFDVSVPRDEAALAALRAALLALAAGYGLLYARDLQVPALSTPALAVIAGLACAPALIALRSSRSAGRLALAPAALVAGWVSAGHWPSPRAPLGGLGSALLDAPSAWVQVVLPFGREHPELRAAVLIALFAWLAVLAHVWLVRPRPLLAGLFALLPLAVSATVYDLPGAPWRALAAAALVLAFVRTGRPAAGGPAIAAACAALALLIGAGWSALPPASRPAVLPWTTWTFAHHADDPPAVGLVWDMRYQPLVYPSKPVEVLQVRASRPSYWRAVVLGSFDGLRFSRDVQGRVDTHAGGGTVRVPSAPVGRPRRAEIAVTTLVDPFLVAPGQPVRYELPPSAGPVDVAADGSAELQAAPEKVAYTAEGVDRDPSAAALRSLPAAYPVDIARELALSGVALPAFGAAGREQRMAQLFRAHRGDPVWRAWRIASAQARRVTLGAASPYQAIVALEAWLRTTRAYDDQASLPEAPDALARWAAAGTSGYCQMFAASLAALARLSGVPARVVEGFAPGTLRGGAYHVTDRDAHAWVEAWFPGYGWLPFDATPGRALPERASASSLSFDGAAAQAPPSGGGRTGSLPRLRLPLSRLGAAGVRSDRGANAGAAWWHGGRALALPALLALALILAKRTLLRLALPADPARAARRKITWFAADQGVELASALTPRELAAALERQFGVDGSAFASALERTAFGAPAGVGEASLERETARLLSALRASLGRARRLRGVFSARALIAARAGAR